MNIENHEDVEKVHAYDRRQICLTRDGNARIDLRGKGPRAGYLTTVGS
jgi:hypothetical protein